MIKIYFVTGNKDKFKEASLVIPELIQVDIDLPEIQSLDPKEIIQNKLQEAQKQLDGIVVVEDQYLDIKCLHGLPGSFIKWFLKTLGVEGIADLVHKYDNHNVIASVILGYSDADKNTHFFEGSISGKIVFPRGDQGFGWDSIFEIESLGKTFAEISLEEKNKISMRKQAFEKLKEFLNSKEYWFKKIS